MDIKNKNDSKWLIASTRVDVNETWTCQPIKQTLNALHICPEERRRQAFESQKLCIYTTGSGFLCFLASTCYQWKNKKKGNFPFTLNLQLGWDCNLSVHGNDL